MASLLSDALDPYDKFRRLEKQCSRPTSLGSVAMSKRKIGRLGDESRVISATVGYLAEQCMLLFNLRMSVSKSKVGIKMVNASVS